MNKDKGPIRQNICPLVALLLWSQESNDQDPRSSLDSSYPFDTPFQGVRRASSACLHFRLLSIFRASHLRAHPERAEHSGGVVGVSVSLRSTTTDQNCDHFNRSSGIRDQCFGHCLRWLLLPPCRFCMGRIASCACQCRVVLRSMARVAGPGPGPAEGDPGWATLIFDHWKLMEIEAKLCLCTQHSKKQSLCM